MRSVCGRRSVRLARCVFRDVGVDLFAFKKSGSCWQLPRFFTERRKPLEASLKDGRDPEETSTVTAQPS